jgi:sarcosine oxidase subunit gamma
VAADTIAPGAQLRRSPVYRVLQRLAAEFARVNDGAVAMTCGGSEAEERNAGARLGLADLSVLPRIGFKGAGTIEWLAEQGLEIGPDSNMAYPQAAGALALRLAPSEIFLLDGLDGQGRWVDRLQGAWRWGEERPRRLVGYPVPRADSHCWLAVTGEKAPAMFSKICGVDLRPVAFAPGRIAQTSLARMSGIILRQPGPADRIAFHVLADSASTEYLWDSLVDAMAEFDGRPIGLSAVRSLMGG